MTPYIGTKQIEATPCSLGRFNHAYKKADRAKEKKAGNYKVRGYLVKYSDDHQGWSPKDVFDAAYRINGKLNFGHALTMLKQGKKIFRDGWNGKGMFVYLVDGSQFKVNRPPLLGIYPEGKTINYNPHMDIKNADGTVSTWSPSNGDALAEDWSFIN